MPVEAEESAQRRVSFDLVFFKGVWFAINGKISFLLQWFDAVCVSLHILNLKIFYLFHSYLAVGKAHLRVPVVFSFLCTIYGSNDITS